MSTSQNGPAVELFRQAADFASNGRLIEAGAAFHVVVEEFPDHALADDALYNEGACALALNQHARAIKVFREVIERYPNAEISEDGPGRHERGATAARAWLGLVAAHLGQGDPAGARVAATQLERYPDSCVTPAPGIRRSFHDVAISLLMAAQVVDMECDEVSS